MRFILSGIIIFIFCSSWMLIEVPSIYRNDGKLIADTTLTITKYRLGKWKKVEDSIMDYGMKNIKYPEMERDGGIQGYVIWSFNVDENGLFADFELQKDTVNRKLSNPLFEKETLRVLKNCSGVFKSFKAAKGKKEKYFFPIVFLIKDAKPLLKNEGYIQIITTATEWKKKEPVQKQESQQ